MGVKTKAGFDCLPLATFAPHARSVPRVRYPTWEMVIVRRRAAAASSSTGKRARGCVMRKRSATVSVA